jgi:DNA-binding NtrC family response regulator
MTAEEREARYVPVGRGLMAVPVPDREPVWLQLPDAGSLRERQARVTRELIRLELERWRWRRGLTARALGITREGLYKLMCRHGLQGR